MRLLSCSRYPQRPPCLPAVLGWTGLSVVACRFVGMKKQPPSEGGFGDAHSVPGDDVPAEVPAAVPAAVPGSWSSAAPGAAFGAVSSPGPGAGSGAGPGADAVPGCEGG